MANFKHCFTAFGLELMWVYVMDCIQEDTEPSSEHFFEWKESVVNPNYNFMYDIVFNCLLH